VKDKSITLLVGDAEIAQRLVGHKSPPMPERGYAALYQRSVTQADEGCDFDFLQAR
jgi:dihydroxy-acid dehydratase